MDDAAMGVRPVRLERRSTAETLAFELRRQILSGAVPPGTRLREVEMADGFGVSRQSLRAALGELVHEGLLRRAPHKGVWVPALTTEELQDIYYLRGILEAEAAARLAAEPDRAEPLRPIIAGLAELPADVSWGVMQEAHLAFHRALVDAVGSPRLSRAYHQLWSEASLGLVASRDHPRAAPRDQAEAHRALLDTILVGPPDVAARSAREHLTIGLSTALQAAADHARPASGESPSGALPGAVRPRRSA
ncbi:MAG TPA: GntR family transcriptional regulator [Candidatus Limnocylindrales bacterium]|nr:GntR family transcriptional regulator [Candidatus Limnocylindrales bacterium]